MHNDTVYTYIDLYQIVDVDEKNGILKAKFWLFYYYYSPAARWNPEDYGNINIMQVPAKTFWTPSIGKFLLLLDISCLLVQIPTEIYFCQLFVNRELEY